MILVTGATGKVGRHVAAQLVAAGTPVRALVRDPGTAVLPEGVEARRGDLTDPASLAAALEGGVDAVFLMWPLSGPGGAAEVVATLAAHARRIVYLSARGVPELPDDAEPPQDILGNHAALERLVRRSGATWTLLRPGGFAGNTLEWAPQVRAGGPVRTAYPQAARTLVHEADIATLAVRALLTDDLASAAPELTGPELLTQAEQIALIGEVLDRPLDVEKLSRPQAREDLLAAGLPPAYADAILDAHAAMETDPETVADGIEALLGRPPLTYRQWVADHADDFR
ncbi:NAD-dependent epimerase/dehydratase family protein [Streptomyces albus subsp. chlorinus]|uniref:SDR family oxidoreductase n=1 Tax=Streptomyces albus TaxID=1888 RepID=UPI001570A10F|nr:NAD(P)H-binding protein [Streptomyces albus]NSC24593.1 NAD-dependent epimerase/dehydratase family protein [Streptomyces albus subsp. chlorinus]